MFTNATERFSHPTSNGIKRVTITLLERDQGSTAEDERNLLKRRRRLVVSQPEHHDKTIADNLRLGTLVRVNDVLHRERMDIEHIADALQQRRIAEPNDIEPLDLASNAALGDMR